MLVEIVDWTSNDSEIARDAIERAEANPKSLQAKYPLVLAIYHHKGMAFHLDSGELIRVIDYDVGGNEVIFSHNGQRFPSPAKFFSEQR